MYIFEVGKIELYLETHNFNYISRIRIARFLKTEQSHLDDYSIVRIQSFQQLYSNLQEKTRHVKQYLIIVLNDDASEN